MMTNTAKMKRFIKSTLSVTPSEPTLVDERWSLTNWAVPYLGRFFAPLYSALNDLTNKTVIPWRRNDEQGISLIKTINQKFSILDSYLTKLELTSLLKRFVTSSDCSAAKIVSRSEQTKTAIPWRLRNEAEQGISLIKSINQKFLVLGSYLTKLELTSGFKRFVTSSDCSAAEIVSRSEQTNTVIPWRRNDEQGISLIKTINQKFSILDSYFAQLELTSMLKRFVTSSDCSAAKIVSRSEQTQNVIPWSSKYEAEQARQLDGQGISFFLNKIPAFAGMTQAKNPILIILNLSFIILLGFGEAKGQAVSINPTGAKPDPSAMLDVSDTTKGFLPPRMSTTNMNAISSPAAGLFIYNTDSSGYFFYNGSNWVSFGEGTSAAYDTLDENIFSARIKSTFNISFSPLSVLSSNIDFVTGGFIINASGIGKLYFKPGFFSVPPSVVITPVNNTDADAYRVGITRTVADTVEFDFNDDIYVSKATDFNIIAIRQGSDYRYNTNQKSSQGPVSLSQLPSEVVDSSRITDADGNTKIQVEETTNDDIIRFDIAGTEFFRMDSGRFEVLNTGKSIFIGDSAGINDDFSDNNNISIGHNAGKLTTTGFNNIAIGTGANQENTTGFYNIAIGYDAGKNQNVGSISNNILIGFEALKTTNTSNSNVVIGNQALRQNAGGNLNTVIGHSSLQALTNGNSNSTLGQSVASSLTSGANNVLIGTNALAGVTSADSNVVIGSQAATSANFDNSIIIGTAAGQNGGGRGKLYIENSSSSTPLIWGDFANDSLKVFGTLGIGNEFTFPNADGTNGQVLQTDGSGAVTWETLAGTDTLSVIKDADGNTKIQVEKTANDDSVKIDIAGVETFVLYDKGRIALRNNNNNVYIGERAAEKVQTGAADNVFIGKSAGVNLSTGDNNVSIGSSSGTFVSTGSNNTFLGYRAGWTTQGDENLMLGKEAGKANKAGAQNTIIGTRAGVQNKGSGNIFIGYQSAGLDTLTDNKLSIDNSSTRFPLIWGDFANDSLKFNSGGVSIIAPNGQDAVLTLASDLDNNNEDENPQIRFEQDGGGNVALIGLEGTDGLTMPGTLSNAFLIGTTSNSDFQIFTNNVPRMTFGNIGLIGIGTNDPLNDLHVIDSTGNGSIRLQGVGAGSDAYLYLRNDLTGYTINNNGTSGRLLIENFSGDDIMSFDSTSRVGIGTGFPSYTLDVRDANSAAKFSLEAESAGDDAEIQLRNTLTDFSIFNKGSSGKFVIENKAGDDLLVIDTLGNVGIGTTTPVSPLQIVGSGTNSEALLRLSPNNQSPWALMVGNESYSTIENVGMGFYVTDAGRSYLAAQGSGATFGIQIEAVEKFTILNNGNVGIGTSNPGRQFEVQSATTGYIAQFTNTNFGASDGNVIIRGGPTVNPGTGVWYLSLQDGDGTDIGNISGNGSGGVQYNTTSDRRLKKDIINLTEALDILSKIKPREYERITLPGVKEFGFIAQELQQVYPQAVAGDSTQSVSERPMSVDYSKLTPLLTASIQELYAIIKKQQAIINSQNARLTEVEAKLNASETQKATNEASIKTILDRLEYLENEVLLNGKK